MKWLRKPQAGWVSYVVLVVEVAVFYGGFGWLFGVWHPGYQDESADLHLLVSLCFVFGVFTFVFFVAVVPPRLVRDSLIWVTTVFIVVALPCMFLSTALARALRLSMFYMRSLEEVLTEVREGRNGIILPLTLHAAGFVVALGFRKLLSKACQYSQSSKIC